MDARTLPHLAAQHSLLGPCLASTIYSFSFFVCLFVCFSLSLLRFFSLTSALWPVGADSISGCRFERSLGSRYYSRVFGTDRAAIDRQLLLDSRCLGQEKDL